MPSILRTLATLLVATFLSVLSGCAHQRLSTPEMEALRGELGRVLLLAMKIDYPDATDPEVEILEALESGAANTSDIRILYRLRYTQEQEGSERVQTARTLEAVLVQQPEGGYRVAERKTALQEMQFDRGSVFQH